MLLRYPNILKIYKTPYPYLKHSFDIIGISEHKIIKDPKNPLLIYLLIIHFVLMKPKPTTEEQFFFCFQQLDLQTSTRPPHQ